MLDGAPGRLGGVPAPPRVRVQVPAHLDLVRSGSRTSRTVPATRPVSRTSTAHTPSGLSSARPTGRPRRRPRLWRPWPGVSRRANAPPPTGGTCRTPVQVGRPRESTAGPGAGRFRSPHTGTARFRGRVDVVPCHALSLADECWAHWTPCPIPRSFDLIRGLLRHCAGSTSPVPGRPGLARLDRYVKITIRGGDLRLPSSLSINPSLKVSSIQVSGSVARLIAFAATGRGFAMVRRQFRVVRTAVSATRFARRLRLVAPAMVLVLVASLVSMPSAAAAEPDLPPGATDAAVQQVGSVDQKPASSTEATQGRRGPGVVADDGHPVPPFGVPAPDVWRPTTDRPAEVQRARIAPGTRKALDRGQVGTYPVHDGVC